MRRHSHRILGAVFLTTGTLHLVKPGIYEAIMPPYLPAHRELVLTSGVAEIAGGAGALVPRLHPVTRWWLLLLLAAVFPANVHMAVNPDQVPGLRVPAWALWARLPLQPLLMVWVWRATGRSSPGAR